MRAQRVAAFRVPGLPLQAFGRDDPTIRERPVAITDGTIILAHNRLAVAAGVRLGMRVTEATTHAANLQFRPHDPQGAQALWDVVLDHLDTLGPVVEDAGLGEALVDVSGVGGSERALVRRTLHALDALLDLTARAAVSDGAFVAAVAARKAANEAIIVPRGMSAAFLAPLPIAVLPFPARMR